MAAHPESNAETRLAAVPAPRLCIRHLMLWTLCCAVYWALIREVNARSTTHIREELFGDIMTGAVFAGVVTLVSIRFRGGPPLLKHPGHWLLLISAIFTVVGTFVIHAVAESIALMSDPFGSWQLEVLIALYLFPPTAFVFAAACIRNRIWKVIFVAMVVVDMPVFLHFVGMDLDTGTYSEWSKLALAAAMVVLSIVELKTGPRRDWMHWTGVMTHFASWIAPMLDFY